MPERQVDRFDGPPNWCLMTEPSGGPGFEACSRLKSNSMMSIWSLPEARGRKFSWIVDHLKPLRDSVAHALFWETGEVTLSADQTLHDERLERWLPLVRCLVRHRVLNEFEEFRVRVARHQT